MNQRKIPPCPPELQSPNRPAARRAVAIDCAPDPGTVWELLAPSGEILKVVIVECFESGEAAPFAFVRGVAVTRFVGSTGPRDSLVELEPSEELAVAHVWLEGPVRRKLLSRCIAKVSAARLLKIESLRVPIPSTKPQEPIASFRKSLKLQFQPVFIDAWRELYRAIDSESGDESNRLIDVDLTHAGPSPLRSLLPQKSKEENLTLAASSRDKLVLDSDASINKTCSVLGDAEVKVVLRGGVDQIGQQQLIVDLIGAREKKRKYRSVELNFNTMPARDVSFQFNQATFSLGDNEIDMYASMFILDLDGNRLQVSFDRPSSST